MKKLIQIIQQNVGWKIAAATTVSLFLVALLILITFSVTPVQWISKFNFIQIFFALVSLLIFLAILVIHLATSIFVTKPLEHFIRTFQEIENGNLKARATINTTDEMNSFSNRFNGMIRQVEELEESRIKAERELTIIQEELKYKMILEEKAKIIEETNRQLERRVQDLSVLYRVSQLISATLDPLELYNVLTDVVVNTLGYQEFSFMIYQEETESLYVKVAHGFKDNEKVKSLYFKIGEGVTGKVAAKKEASYIRDTSVEPAYLHYKGEKMEEGSFLSLPIVSHRRLLGVMNFFRPGIDSFSSMDIKLLTSLASQVAVAMENSALYAKTKELAVTDDLTHVYNRRYFHTMLQMELKRAKRFTRNMSLLMVDVDHFKQYNDTHGHLEGDRALEEIAKILSVNVREVDTVARYGGEEFGVILVQTSAAEAMTVAEKLCRLIEKKSFRSEANFSNQTITVSIGVSNFPEDADSIEDLINHADIALYQAKNLGRNRVKNFTQIKSSGLRVV